MPHFNPFPGFDSIERKHRNLPHWTYPGVTYFVTFRLADSIPKSALKEWEARKTDFLTSQAVSDPTELSPKLQWKYRKRFGREYQLKLDECHGECLLKEPCIRDIVEDAMHSFNEERYHLGDFVIMPNHVHSLLVPRSEWPLSKILHSWKSFSAHEINKTLKREGPVWQSESYDHIVRTREELDRIRRYIRRNPEKSKLSSSQFTFGSAEWTFES